MSRPAVLGGAPAFDPALPFARPTIEEPDRILASIGESLESGMLTNGPVVRNLEERVAEAFEVEHCVAVASCTLGLLLVVQAAGSRNGRAVVPSFTFSATAHSVRWNGLAPEFVDCDPDTWLMGPEHVPDDAGLIVGVHVSGMPCDVDGLAKRASEVGADLIFDAAHGAGSLIDIDGDPRPLGGFGRAEVFSLTPTKVMSGAEGGLITTNDDELAARLRIARDYGNPGDYDTRFAGLNARLSELHAAMALASMDHLEERVEHRNEVANRYRTLLSDLDGVGFQQTPTGARSSYKDFTITIDEGRFGLSRSRFVRSLQAEGIATRPYYSPPVHHQTAYADLPPVELPTTERLASRVVSLPMWSHLPFDTVERIGEAIARIRDHAGEIGDAAATG